MPTSNKIRLRPLGKQDADDLYVMLNRPELIGRRYLPGGHSDDLPLSRRSVESVLEQWLSGEKQTTLAVATTDTEQLVGYAGMGWGWDALCPWLCVVVDPSRWRRGYGSEALDKVLVHLYGTTVAHSISCWLPEWNREGLAFARKHGFRPCGRIRRAGVRDGAWYDTIPLDMLRREWLASRGGAGDDS